MDHNILDLLIKGDLVLESGVADDSGVGVKDGVIVGLYGPQENPLAKATIDAGGLLVFPGIVDAHVHSFSIPGVEGFLGSTPAAAAGGVTTFIEMPYDAGSPTTSPEAFRKKIERIRHEAMVDVALLATLKKEGPLSVIFPLVELGACGFKLSLFETDAERFPRIADGILWDILPAIAACRVPAGFHAENDDIIFHLIRKYRLEGKNYPKAHCQTRPVISETTAILKLLELAHWTGVRLHLYHVSHPRSVHLLRRFREEGVDVTAETCPHYLLFNEEDMDRLKALVKINPPLRAPDAVEEMWEMLKDGLIDMVASDHAPWPIERKQDPDIFANASGAPGVETLFPLMFSEGVIYRGFSPAQLARILCEQPARRFKLYPRKGHIALGADADFAILDPTICWTIKGSDMRSSAQWTPYEGITVQGKVVKTILRGQVIYDGKKITAKPGGGQFIAALEG